MKPPKAATLASESTRKWWSCPGFIYFLAAGKPPKAIKIGMAAITGKHTLQSALVRRVAQIQSSNHELIEVLGAIHFTEGEFPTRDADARERELHIEFKHLQRFKSYLRGAEWFTPAPELHARIEEIAARPEALGLPKTSSHALPNDDSRA
jgi:hypothetical protein